MHCVASAEGGRHTAARSELHRIGEDVSEKLDVIPAQFRVLVVRRPKYACRACEDVVVQAPAVARLIEGGLPTEATVADVLVAKYADHLPLYRQAQIYERQGIHLDRSTLADWVGRAAFHLRPIRERILAHLRSSTKLFADETTAPVLDPGRGRTRPGSSGPMRGTIARGAARTCLQLLMSMLPTGRRRSRSRISPASKAFSKSTVTRAIVRLPKRATSASRSAGPMCGVASTNALSPRPRRSRPRRCNASRCSMRSRKTFAAAAPTNAAPPVKNDRFQFLSNSNPGCAQISLSSARRASSPRRSATLSRWEGLTRFLDDGRIEIDSNTVERSIRPIALNRKNALFAGSDGGGQNWAVIATLIENCKLCGVEPHAYLADVIGKIVNGHPNSAIDELLPSAYAAPHPLKAVA
jgi:transposase